VFFLSLLWLFALPAMADRLHFTDGESITGSLLGVGDGQVRWRSDILGELTIEQHHVRHIETGEHYDLRTSGQELTNCWMFVQRDRQHLHCDQGVQVLPSWKLVVAAGDAILDPPPALTQKGNVVLAFEDSTGNNEITKYNIDARSELRYIESRHTLGLLYQEEQAANATTRNRWRTSYQYDQFFTAQWFVTGNAFHEEDEFKEIDSRSSVGLGMGYQFLETSYIDLLGKVTINYVDETFNNAPNRSTPAFLWNLDFAWRFNERGMEFFHRHVVLQAFESYDDWEVSTITGLKYPINGHFSSVFQLEYDYDNLPAEDRIDKRDSKWSVGLNYNW
jgi:putative salt-induced outer membrane protein YdiY